MVTPIEVLMARVATMENLAKAYAHALVAYHQAGENDRDAHKALCDAQNRLNWAAMEVANTI